MDHAAKPDRRGGRLDCAAASGGDEGPAMLREQGVYGATPRARTPERHCRTGQRNGLRG